MANDVTAPGMDQLRRDFDTLRGDFARLANDLRNVASSQIEDGVARARAMGQEAAKQAERAAAEARQQVERAAREARQQVVEHPGVSLAAAFGIGLAIGVLMGRTRS